MERALEGVRVISLAHQYPGPYATLLLADLGAEIIVVENPAGGDPARSQPGFHAALNRGKASVALDLKDPAARDAFLRLTARADVVLEGFRPGTMSRLGLDYETLRELNPGLVYVSISGFGQTGPYRDRPGHDLTYQAEAGMLHDYDIGGGPRPPGPLAIGDLSAGLFAVQAVLLGLLRRATGGEGGYHDVSMFDGLVSLLTAHISPVANGTGGAGFAAEPGYGVFTTADGHAIALGVAHEDHFWRRLCEVVGLKGEAALSREARLAQGERLGGVIAAVVVQDDAATWEKRLTAADVPFGRVRSLDEMPQHGQARARSLFPPLADGRATGQIGVRNPLADPALVAPGPAPALGADTVRLLVRAGLDDDEIAAMLRRGAARQAHGSETEG